MWKYCSSDPPPIISSTTDIVRVSYVYQKRFSFVDKYNTFRLEWIVDGCGGTLNKYSGEFTSPGYPGYYPPSTTCEWNIAIEYKYSIQITISDLSFETSSSCTKDYLVVRKIMFDIFPMRLISDYAIYRFIMESMILVQNCYAFVINKPIRSL